MQENRRGGGGKQSHGSNCNRYNSSEIPKISRFAKEANLTRVSFDSEICQGGNRFFIEKVTETN